MDFEIIKQIKEELDKFDVKEYSLVIKFKDNNDITITKNNANEDKKQIGF